MGVFHGDVALEKVKKKVLNETGRSLKIHVIDTTFQPAPCHPTIQDFNYTAENGYKSKYNRISRKLR